MGEFNVEAAIIKLQGGIDRVNDGVSSLRSDIGDVKQRVNRHSDRLHALETDRAQRLGVQQGVTMSTKVIYSVIGLGGAGTLAAIVGAVIQVAR